MSVVMGKASFSRSVTESDIALLTACAPLRELPPSARLQVLGSMSTLEVPAGQDIVVQGTEGERFFVVLDGTVEVVRIEKGIEIDLTELGSGAYFGEQALLCGSRLRRATVRSKSDCRLAALSSDVFVETVANAGRNRERFGSDAAKYVYQQMSRSLDRFVATGPEDETAGVERCRFEGGETITSEGEASDAAYLLLSGLTIAYKEFDGVRREVARMGAGQIFGELGILEREPRAATVVADGDVELLRIPANAFLSWQRAHPSTGRVFNSLAQVYHLAEGRRLTLYMGDLDGERSTTCVRGDSLDGVVATRLQDHGVVVFTNRGAEAIAGERAVLRYGDDAITRELHVIVKERAGSKIARCIVFAVEATGIEADLGTLYKHVVELDEVPAVALRRFERSGFIGGEATRSERFCACLALSPRDIAEAANEMGADYETLQSIIGVGAVCGGCEAPIRAFLDDFAREESPPGTTDADVLSNAGPDEAVADVPLEELSDDERQFAALLQTGLGLEERAITRAQLAVALRATSVPDVDALIDILFPGAFADARRASYAALAASVTRGIGFGEWRRIVKQPLPWDYKLPHYARLGVYLLGRRGIASILAGAAAGSIALSPATVGPLWAVALGAGGLGYLALGRSPTGRFHRTIATHGLAAFYRALWAAHGDETRAGTVGLSAPKMMFFRSEDLVSRAIEHPHIYARQATWDYPPFGAHSVLGGGATGAWLGYRMLFEEYFSEGYLNDLPEMRQVVRERIETWAERRSIQLLDELYRIILEIRARVFFQTTFDCFDDDAEVDFVGAVDRALGPEVVIMNGWSGDDVRIVHERVQAAVLGTHHEGAHRKGSLGGIFREALDAGHIDELEARDNAAMYVMAQAPTMGLFWTLYRAARGGSQSDLVADRRELVKALKEEMRLHAPVPSMFQRVVQQDDSVGGVDVPAGTKVNLSPLFIHTNPKHWTDPYTYDRERWQAHVGDCREVVDNKTDPDDDGSRPKEDRRCPRSARYIPFGNGVQICQGRWFAADEMLLVAEEILSRYELEVVEDDGLLDRPLYDQVTMHVYSRPRHDVTLRPRPRKASGTK